MWRSPPEHPSRRAASWWSLTDELDAPIEPPADTPPPSPPPAPARRKRRVLTRGLKLLLALIAAAIVASFTIDLGPGLKKRAETAGSNYLDRPIHMGRLSLQVGRGAFEVDDLVIEGLKPTDKPFLTARRVFLFVPWWTIFTHELIVDTVEMSDWDMRVEQFPGKHSFPRVLGPKRPPRTGEPRFKFTTTVKQVISRNGRFTYEDHTVPWSVVCPNLDVSVFKGLDTYRGTAQFSKGSVKIQNYEQFGASMQTRFRIDGGRIVLEDINLQSDGASTAVTGYVDMKNWPEMIYNVKSRIDFPIQKGIFFKGLNFTVAGTGDFTGTFRFFKTATGTGHELKGTFTSAQAGVNAWRFSNVHGALLWDNGAFKVTDVTTGLYGGRATFDYLMLPLGQPGKQTMAVWDTTYAGVDLRTLSDFLEIQGIRLDGLASGRNRLEWPLGKFSEKRGSGVVTAQMAARFQPMARVPRADQIAAVDPLPPEEGPFNPLHPLGYVPVAGNIAYTLDPEWITLAPGGWAATEKTYVEFTGRTAWADRSTIPFHVTSLDWLESDRVLAGIMTAFGSPTGTIDIGGRGEFDGTMYGAFGRPRIEGHFTGDRMRAWDRIWGHAVADLVIENSYVDIRNSTITEGASKIEPSGRFSLGYPRKDGGEEINANIRMTRRPLADLRHAFELDDWPVEGLTSGEFHVYGKYLNPFGTGRLQIDSGRAYGESFEVATSNLKFEGTGVRMESMDVRKATGRLTGAAWIGWDGTYSFDADGTRIPVESLDLLTFPQAPLSGILDFTATGAGAFDNPRYDVKATIADLFVKDEGIGQVSGTLSLRGNMLTLSELNAQSRRLSVTGQGRLALTPEQDVDLTLRFSDTSLDPYIRLLAGFSPFNTIIADGTLRASGELADIDHLVVETTVDKLQLKLFDYPATNDGKIELALDNHVIEVRRFKLAGDQTELDLSGTVDLHQRQIALDASGDANLGILQAFYSTIRSAGTTTLHAQVRGSLDNPVFSGDATITGGRVRYFSLPHSLQDFNGRLLFDAQGIRIVDAVAQLGGGPVTFGGRIGLNGFRLGAIDLTARGEQMQLRYPEDFRSTVDADLTLRGDPTLLVLGGSIVIRDGLYSKRLEPNVDIFSLVSGGNDLPVAAVSETASLPVRYDVHVLAPGTLRLVNNLARIVARADLTLNGTYDHPVLFGRADIERGEILFEGNRYRITRGTIDFLNPSRIQPFFDIEAEGRIRSTSLSPGSSSSATDAYRVTLGVSGSLEGRMNLSLNSDPPLPTVDIISLVFGQPTGDLSNPELRSLSAQTTSQSEEQLLRAMFVRIAVGSITGSIGRAVEQTLGIDTVQIMPGLGSSVDPLTPTARLILGKRISSRAYLTYSKALSTTTNGDQVIVLEYDQSDRIGWVLTQTGAYTFAIDLRVRRTF